MPTSVERDSNLRRIQRFIANYALNLDLVARMIFSLLPVKDGLVLVWTEPTGSSESSTSIYSLSASPTKALPFHCCSVFLDKRGNSIGMNAGISWSGSSDFFGHDCIDCLVADREFIGKEWIGWLNDNRIRYYIRIRQDIWVVKPSTGERIRAWWLFNSL